MPSEAGFSLVEALIAAAVLLIVSVGVLPMFTLSITNNIQAQETTRSVNEARSQVEEFAQAQFNAADYEVEVGETESTFVEYWSEAQHKWIDEASWPSGEVAAVTRTVEMAQYSVGALDDGELEDAERLAGGTEAAAIHLKEVIITVETEGPSGSPGKTTTLRMLKAL